MRRWLGLRTLEELNRAARGIETESGHPIQFVPPSPDPAPYEIRIYERDFLVKRAAAQ